MAAVEEILDMGQLQAAGEQSLLDLTSDRYMNLSNKYSMHKQSISKDICQNLLSIQIHAYA